MTPRSRISAKAARFTESVIREMTRLAMKHEAINLAQGFPDFPAPNEIKMAACEAVLNDINQYAVTWGAPAFRRALAAKTRHFLGLEIDPDKHVTVCCGSTEAMISAMLAVVDPGDEVVIFEPFYENYGPDAILSGAVPRYVKLNPPDWSFDRDELAAAFNDKTRAIIINTPNNPTGKVFTRDELTFIAELCEKWNALAITDEIYEHILYDGAEHVAIATLPGMFDRTITINGMSKTYSVTGWRVGYAIAPADLTSAIRKVHDFLTVGAAAPLQEAGVVAMSLEDSYYRRMVEDYTARRAMMLDALDRADIPYYRPKGAYYVMTEIGRFGFDTDVAFTKHLIEDVGVAVVPGSSFYHRQEDGRGQVRFCFCKTSQTLSAAAERLKTLKPLTVV